ncbi:MAG: phosphatidate cytidylyltransferase [Nitrospirae bacterium]|nr:phosphatidate cytidylyltransferase [Nitrospirota bacterium]
MPYKRIASAAVLIPLVYLLVWHGSPFQFYIAVLCMASVGIYEFYRMFNNSGYHPQTMAGMLAGLLVVTGFYIGAVNEGDVAYVFSPGVMVAGAFVFALICRLFSERDTNGAMVDVALTFTGVIYVAWLSAYLVLLKTWDMGGVAGRELVFLLLLVTWATDTGAYFAGSKFGRHKLYPKISPKKSVEGAAGGLLGAVGTAVLCRYWFFTSLTMHDAVAIGLILGIVGQVGDLAESMIKRSARVKDSGALIPGHGGMLDRVDSLLLNAPALYYYTVVMVSKNI